MSNSGMSAQLAALATYDDSERRLSRERGHGQGDDPARALEAGDGHHDAPGHVRRCGPGLSLLPGPA